MKTTPISENISTNVAAKEQKEYNEEESSSNEAVETVSRKLKRNIAGMSYKWVKVVKKRKEGKRYEKKKKKSSNNLNIMKMINYIVKQ